jgi:hypothetical protein
MVIMAIRFQITDNNIRLSQYVKERLSRMQSRTCSSYAEAMVLHSRATLAYP